MARLRPRSSHAPSSRFDSATPAPTPGSNSDQENQDPVPARSDKGKGGAMSPPHPRPQQRASRAVPTPDTTDARGQKRKRTTRPTQETSTPEDVDEDYQKFHEFYDPNQDPETRREQKRKSRALEREFQESRDEILHGDGERLEATLDRANSIFRQVKQTGDATVDARLMVNVSDLAYKKTAQLLTGDSSTGVDVDEFLSKCISYMRNGGPLDDQINDAAPSSSRRRTDRHRAESDDEDEEDASGEALDFELLGRTVCFPHNSRPPVPSFLLGPLSVEKKQRKETQRRAKEAKDTNSKESRPEALTKDDLQQAEQNGLTQICTRIRKQLVKHIRDATHNLIDVAGLTQDDMGTTYGRDMLRKHRISGNLGVPLFDFVLNPGSFGQTVENLFYISFLIKEGGVAIKLDDDELPTINIPGDEDKQVVEQAKQKGKASRHQAVFALDYATWRDLCRAFEVSEPMIAHRVEEIRQHGVGVGEKGWYT
ncbi:hypothetical protein LTR02_013686 [Friedmanniomyces endolithicus]|nr:hypothetical protein LTR75_011843 [Friedmanniomyces endolithicus]KAK0891992.1 hypothetical protein LTR02_013686 [Friedmanniomyces endolithicus]